MHALCDVARLLLLRRGQVCAIDPDPVPLGQPCEVEADHKSTGLDLRERGAVCWDVMDNGIGTCMALCGEPYEDPTCPTRTQCYQDKDGVADICLPDCEPLDDTCPIGCGCYLGIWGFSCRPDLSGDEGERGDPCDGVQMCKSGLSCREGAIEDCAAQSCCTPYCELNGTETQCAEGEACVSDGYLEWLELGRCIWQG